LYAPWERFRRSQWLGYPTVRPRLSTVDCRLLTRCYMRAMLESQPLGDGQKTIDVPQRETTS
jgi:hypothetical protein